MRKLKYLWLYIKYHKNINELYAWHVRNYGWDENASWLERTWVWYISE